MVHHATSLGLCQLWCYIRRLGWLVNGPFLLVDGIHLSLCVSVGTTDYPLPRADLYVSFPGWFFVLAPTVVASPSKFLVLYIVWRCCPLAWSVAGLPHHNGHANSWGCYIFLRFISLPVEKCLWGAWKSRTQASRKWSFFLWGGHATRLTTAHF